MTAILYFTVFFFACLGLSIVYAKTIGLTLWELFLCIGGLALLLGSGYALVYHSLITDTEYWGSKTVKVVHHQYWNEWINRTCTDCTTDSNGNRHCTTRDCSYCSEHPEYWELIDEYRNAFEISETRYKELCQLWHGDEVGTKIEMNRRKWDACYSNRNWEGNIYFAAWDGKRETLVPVSTKHKYENKIPVARSNLNWKKLSKEQKELVYDYPKIKGYRQECLLGDYNPEVDQKIQVLNAIYGPKNEVRVYIIRFDNKPLKYALLQQAYWQGGNQNEIVVCLGTKDEKLDWVYTFSWTKSPKFNERINQKIQKIGFDYHNILEYLESEIKVNWIRRDFKTEFEYLHIEVPFWSGFIVMFIAMALTFVLLIVLAGNKHTK